MVLSEIIQKVGDWLNRENLAPIIPTWLDFVKVQLERENNFRYMEASLSTTLSSSTIEQPSNYKEIESCRVTDSNGETTILTKTSANYAWSQYPNASSDTGTPILVANTVIPSGRVFLFRPTPLGSFTLDLNYYAYSGALSDTHWLVANAPDLLIYGALLEAEPYLKTKEFIDVWVGKVERALKSIAASEQREKFAGSPQRVKPAGEVV